ncbi:hypothetical protein JXA48_02360 [Candidatus Woesearchaeota archaeon]|nr:hypothetical protein [Candidatus Woesearchaeota archaeon]
MGFLGNLLGKRKHEYDALEDEPITGYDPAASESKVNNYLGKSYDDSFSDSRDPLAGHTFEDSGLPPEPENNYSPSVARTPSGVSAQEMADKYLKQQEYAAKQQQQPQQSEQMSHKEEIINLKLDSMKNQLDALSQRMQRIEQLLTQNQNKRW